MTNELERQIINLIAADRIGVPIKSLAGKIDRMKPKLAEAINLPEKQYQGERVYARVEETSVQKAKGMRAAIDQFKEMYPKQGELLQELIDEQRTERETALYFGVNPESKLSANDYMEVMGNLGFNERNAIQLYPVLMDTSRKISRARDYEERSILIG